MTLISEPLPPNEIKLYWTLSVNKGKLIKLEEGGAPPADTLPRAGDFGAEKSSYKVGVWGLWSKLTELFSLCLKKHKHIEDTKSSFLSSIYTVLYVLMVESYFSKI